MTAATAQTDRRTDQWKIEWKLITNWLPADSHLIAPLADCQLTGNCLATHTADCLDIDFSPRLAVADSVNVCSILRCRNVNLLSNRADTLTNISTCTDVGSRRVIHRSTHRAREIPAMKRFIYQADFDCWKDRLILIASRLFAKENTVQGHGKI